MTTPQVSTVRSRVLKSESRATREVSQEVLDACEFLTVEIYAALAEAGADWVIDCAAPSGFPHFAVGGFRRKSDVELRMFELDLCGRLKIDALADEPVSDVVDGLRAYADELNRMADALDEQQAA